jgi:hypothetical protein
MHKSDKGQVHQPIPESKNNRRGPIFQNKTLHRHQTQPQRRHKEIQPVHFEKENQNVTGRQWIKYTLIDKVKYTNQADEVRKEIDVMKLPDH